MTKVQHGEDQNRDSKAENSQTGYNLVHNEGVFKKEGCFQTLIGGFQGLIGGWRFLVRGFSDSDWGLSG